MTADDRLPWFPCYQSKLLGALAGMPFDVGYVYSVVLLRTYEVGGTCPDSAAVLARRMGATERRVAKAVDWLVEQGKLIRSDLGLVNPFAVDILAEAKTFRNGRIQAGKSGAKKRWQKDKQNQSIDDSKAIGQPMANDSHLHLHKQEQKKVSKQESPRLREDDYPPDAFDRFWTLYPPGRKGAKKATASKFDGIRRRGEVTFERLMAGLQRFIDSRPDPQYTKAPEVWLNKGCWDDEYFNRGSHGKTQGAVDTSQLGFAGLAALARRGPPESQRPSPEDLEPINRR